MKKTNLQSFNDPPYAQTPDYAAELACLQTDLQQEQPYFQMQGLPSMLTYPSNPPYILSVTCGPKGWLFDTPHKNIRRHILRIDQRSMLVEYARAHEWLGGMEHAEQKLRMLLQQFEAIPANTFELVHLSYVAGYMPTSAFPILLCELVRVCRPGGIIRWDEGELPTTTSLACEQVVVLILRALQTAGRGFSPLGVSPEARTLSIILQMRNSLSSADCSTLRHIPVLFSVSFGSTTNPSFLRQMQMMARQARPFLLQAGEITEEGFNEVYAHLQKEILHHHFQGTCSIHVMWGKKSLGS